MADFAKMIDFAFNLKLKLPARSAERKFSILHSISLGNQKLSARGGHRQGVRGHLACQGVPRGRLNSRGRLNDFGVGGYLADASLRG